MFSPMPMRTIGSRMWLRRERVLAMRGLRAKTCPAAHQTATRGRKTRT
jgi:hypothetical protein